MIVGLLILVALIALLLGILVFSQQPRLLSVIFFFLANIGAAAWSLGIAIFLTSSDSQTLFNVAQVYYIAAASIACSMLLFSLTFASKTRVSLVKLTAVAAPFLLMSAGIIINPKFLINGVQVSSVSNTADLNMSAYAIYILYFVSYYLAALFILWKRSKTNGQVLRRHFEHIFIAYGVSGIVGTFFNLFLPALGNYQLIWIGPLGLTLFVPIVYLAIAKYGLFDIRQTVVRTVAYISSLLALAAIYYLVAYLISTVFLQGQISSSVSVSPINILLALLLAFIFQPIKHFFDQVTNNVFYRDNYNSDEFFARLSRVLTTTTDLRSLLERAATEIGTTLKAEQAFLFVYHMQDHHISAGTKAHSSLPVQDARRLDAYADESGDGVIVAELLPEDHAIRRLLQSHKIAVLLPLARVDQVIGYLALGEQLSSGYTNRDIKVLTTISDELVIAVQNSLSVQEVRDINVHLQQRIDTATAELRSSNTQLRHLDKTKDEFLSMASHQLRTPLTSVKGYLSMVLEGDAGKVTDSQKRLLGEAFTSSERMVHLIHDFLNVSRLQTGKFMLELHPYDIVKLVDEEVRSLQRAAETRNMKLEFINSIDTLMLNIDENKIRQVVMNYIDNALFYSHDDSTIRVELTMADDQVELRVKDTGIGVPKSEQTHLFSKFYRATNARKQRPDGTGVGIFLAKKVIVEHGGDVLFESVEDKGSTFGFTLPIKKLAVSSDEKADQPDQ